MEGRALGRLLLLDGVAERDGAADRLGVAERDGAADRDDGAAERLDVAERDGVADRDDGAADRLGVAERDGVDERVDGAADRFGIAERDGADERVDGVADRFGIAERDGAADRDDGAADRLGVAERDGADERVDGTADRFGVAERDGVDDRDDGVDDGRVAGDEDRLRLIASRLEGCGELLVRGELPEERLGLLWVPLALESFEDGVPRFSVPRCEADAFRAASIRALKSEEEFRFELGDFVESELGVLAGFEFVRFGLFPRASAGFRVSSMRDLGSVADPGLRTPRSIVAGFLAGSLFESFPRLSRAPRLLSASFRAASIRSRKSVPVDPWRGSRPVAFPGSLSLVLPVTSGFTSREFPDSVERPFRAFSMRSRSDSRDEPSSPPSVRPILFPSREFLSSEARPSSCRLRMPSSRSRKAEDSGNFIVSVRPTLSPLSPRSPLSGNLISLSKSFGLRIPL